MSEKVAGVPGFPMPPGLAARLEEIFPKLTADEVSRMKPFARERPLAAGEVLFEPGTSRVPFYVVIEGALSMVQDEIGGERLIVRHEAGGFTGELAMLSNQPTLVRARAEGLTRILEIDYDRFRELVATDAQIGQTILRAFILRRQALVARGEGELVLVGSRHSSGTLRLQEFLSRNGYPYSSLDVETDSRVQGLLDLFSLRVEDVPVVICRGNRVLKNPSVEELATCLGLSPFDETVVRDLVVVGAGPAGLSAAVYAASEGLNVLVLEAYAPGGQAGTSSRIENYLGFPTGISGRELASRAFVQAEKFGAEISVARSAARLGCDRRPYRIEMDGTGVQARAVVIATGAQYRKPAIPDLERFEGVGIYYGATPIEANLCRGEDVVVVGGANSAGQAAVFLAENVRHVDMLLRGPDLGAKMSRYLVRRIEETPNIRLWTETEIASLEGGDHLERVTWVDRSTGERSTQDRRHVFLMVGALPNTKWLGGCVALDEKGFIKTGQDIGAEDLKTFRWPLSRLPYFFETSLPGVFAVGDVRSSSTKRVAAAVGEGAVCIQLVHRVLAE